MDRIFSDSTRLQRMLDFEAALAQAERSLGVIPESAAAPIQQQCQARFFDTDDLARKAASAGNLAIPVVKQLTELVSSGDAQAGRYVHWGATSQDVIDTGLVLQIREALELIDSTLVRLIDCLVRLTEEHRRTPVVARTWMQHAIPTLFGLKVAGWLDALLRELERLREAKGRALVLQFGGAAGTLSALGDHGMDVSQALAAELQLTLPAMPWHSQRDRIAEVASTLSLLSGSLAKIARDVSLEMQTEIGELAEPSAPGKGGSSTMPHKRNPIACSVILAAATRVPGLAGTLLSAMPQEHERGLGGWQAEWETLPQVFRLTAGALERAVELMDGLQVFPEVMARNLDATNGLIFAESVSMAIARHVGKSEAHRIVEAASQRATSSGQHFRDVLLTDDRVRAHLSASQIHDLFNPASSTGATNEFIDRVLAEARTHLRGERD